MMAYYSAIELQRAMTYMSELTSKDLAEYSDLDHHVVRSVLANMDTYDGASPSRSRPVQPAPTPSRSRPVQPAPTPSRSRPVQSAPASSRLQYASSIATPSRSRPVQSAPVSSRLQYASSIATPSRATRVPSTMQGGQHIQLPPNFSEGKGDSKRMIYVNHNIKAALYKNSGGVYNSAFKIINEHLRDTGGKYASSYKSLANTIKINYGVEVTSETIDPDIILQSCELLGVHLIIYDGELEVIGCNKELDVALRMILHNGRYFHITSHA